MSPRKDQSKQLDTRAKRKAQAKELSPKQRLLKALQHPLRAKILAYMNDREWSPNEIAEEFVKGLSQVSYHVIVLLDYELIELTKTEPRRGAVEHFYRAIERAYIPTSMAKEIPMSGRRIIGSDILKAMDEDVGASIASGRFYDRDDCHVSWTPAVLDEEGRQEANELADEFVDRYIEIDARSAARRAKKDGKSERIPTGAAVLVYGSEHEDQKKAPTKRPAGKKRPKKKRK